MRKSSHTILAAVFSTLLAATDSSGAVATLAMRTPSVPHALPLGAPIAPHAPVLGAAWANAPALSPALALTPAPLVGVSPAPQAPVPLKASLSREMPDFSKIPASGQKSAAADDFAARLGAPEGASPVSAEDPAAPAEIIVTAPASIGVAHDISRAQARRLWAAKDASVAGISLRDASRFQATLFGAVRKIDTIVFNAPRSNGQAFIDHLVSLGYEARFGEVIPKPEILSLAGKTVSLKEMSSLIRADRLQRELKKVLGEPQAPSRLGTEDRPSFFAQVWQRVRSGFHRAVLGASPVNPDIPWALMDGYSWTQHPFLKGRFVKEVDNSNDRDEHGTHTAGTVVGVDIFNYSGRVYNIFPFGSATEGDILLKLNAAQKDGALATTNSWGNGSGDPGSSYSKLFIKQAQEGMHHSVSAGNDGPDPNTIGAPAIASYEAPLVIGGKTIGQVKRIKAVAATDADKATADFSSRGPGSHVTSGNPGKYPDHPLKPDEAGIGVNLVAPTPTGSHVADLGGPGKAMSGTSMSNPGVFGGFLLLTRGILVLLDAHLPKGTQAERSAFAMDVARYAMTQTARKLERPEDQGDGFIDVWAAFQYAENLLKPSRLAPQPSGPATAGDIHAGASLIASYIENTGPIRAWHTKGMVARKLARRLQDARAAQGVTLPTRIIIIVDLFHPLPKELMPVLDRLIARVEHLREVSPDKRAFISAVLDLVDGLEAAARPQPDDSIESVLKRIEEAVAKS